VNRSDGNVTQSSVLGFSSVRRQLAQQLRSSWHFTTLTFRTFFTEFTEATNEIQSH